MSGEYDKSLDEFKDAIHERRRAVAYSALHSMRPGDRVIFTSGRPRYLIGVEATVVKIKQTYASVRLDQPIGKFRGVINTPMTLIRKKV